MIYKLHYFSLDFSFDYLLYNDRIIENFEQYCQEIIKNNIDKILEDILRDDEDHIIGYDDILLWVKNYLIKEGFREIKEESMKNFSLGSDCGLIMVEDIKKEILDNLN